MKQYDAYLFDWDGTLARSLELWLDEIYKQFCAYGLKITKKENARLFGNLKSPLLYGLPEHLLSQFQEEINAKVKAQLLNTPLYDDAKTMLEALHAQGKKLALITTSLRGLLDQVIGRHDLEKFFDVVITSEDVKHHKPDPEGILKALDSLAVAPAKALFLGDSSHDLLAARNAGIDSVLFYPEVHELMYDLEHLQAHTPTYTVRAWRELINQLQ